MVTCSIEYVNKDKIATMEEICAFYIGIYIFFLQLYFLFSNLGVWKNGAIFNLTWKFIFFS